MIADLFYVNPPEIGDIHSSLIYIRNIGIIGNIAYLNDPKKNCEKISFLSHTILSYPLWIGVFLI